jgi:AcrR family transcriptional regulator
MHSISAKVAKEIIVLLDHSNRHARASEQVTQHHARRAAAYNAARGFRCVVPHKLVRPAISSCVNFLTDQSVTKFHSIMESLMPIKSKKPARQTKASKTRADKTAGRRSAIIDAALDEFAEKGFVAARMEDIAKRARVAKGTIYLKFHDKEALFEAIVRQEISPLIGAMASERKSGETVRSFLDRTIFPFLHDLHRSRRGVVIRLLIAEAARFPKLAELYFHMIVEPGLAVFSNLARVASEGGEIKGSAFIRYPQLFVAPAVMGLLWSGLFEDYCHLDVEGMLRAYFDQLFLAEGSSGQALYPAAT